FLKSGAHAYVTGDIKYHEAREIEQAGLGLIDVGHFASERIAVDLLCEKIKLSAIKKGICLEIEGFYADSDPFIMLYDL
ncbi:MAG: Nif3-like dinuclear metal center hexameric protein, partial [Desulfamplus sp.]|nr:Nif3-like dinuclear metal center hexameric protein [Desulfamplus sp.]